MGELAPEPELFEEGLEHLELRQHIKELLGQLLGFQLSPPSNKTTD
jgi:hypothetical protein